MNKAKALKVLAEVQDYVGDHHPSYGPQLMDHNHEELSPGSWSICYEGGMDMWAVSFKSKVPGVFTEAIMGCIMAVYDA